MKPAGRRPSRAGGRGVGSIYLEEYLKILDRAGQVMERFPLSEMTQEERRAIVLSYVNLIEKFQGQLKDAGIRKLLDLFPDRPR